MTPAMWFALGLALAGPKGDAKRLLADARWEEASGMCRAELAVHPGRGWAEDCVVEATRARVGAHIEQAERAADRQELAAALAQLEAAHRLVRQAAVSGVVLVEPTLDAAQLRRRAASPGLARAEAAASRGQWSEAVAAFRSTLALLDPAEHGPVEAQLTDALRHAAEAATGLERAELYETLASRTGSDADRGSAALAWQAYAVAAEARGAVRQAVEGTSRALVHDPALDEELARLERLARTDVLLRISGADAEAVAALREGLEAALRGRGSRFLRVLARGGSPRRVPGEDGPAEVGPARLVVRVGHPVSTQGEPTMRRVTRPEGAITKVIQEGSLVVEVSLDVDATLQVAERTERTRRTETAAETARWDGKVQAVRTPAGGRKLRGSPRSGERKPAVAEARQHATAVVITRLASLLASEVLRQVDREDPRSPPPSKPQGPPPPSQPPVPPPPSAPPSGTP